MKSTVLQNSNLLAHKIMASQMKRIFDIESRERKRFWIQKVNRDPHRESV